MTCLASFPSRLARGLLATFVLAAAAPASAAVVAPAPLVEWGDTFLLLGTDVGNPSVRIGLIPMYPPDPIHPPEPGLDLADPFAPVVTVPTAGFAAPDNAPFQVLLAIAAGQRLDPSLPAGAPDGSGHFSFDVFSPAGGKVFSVVLDVVTVPDAGGGGGPGVPGSWVAFNPQPEPPAHNVGDAVMGFNFDYTHFSDATLTLQVLDAGGNPIGFRAVPEPATLALLLAGLAVVRRERGR